MSVINVISSQALQFTSEDVNSSYLKFTLEELAEDDVVSIYSSSPLATSLLRRTPNGTFRAFARLQSMPSQHRYKFLPAHAIAHADLALRFTANSRLLIKSISSQERRDYPVVSLDLVQFFTTITKTLQLDGSQHVLNISLRLFSSATVGHAILQSQCSKGGGNDGSYSRVEWVFQVARSFFSLRARTDTVCTMRRGTCEW